MTNRLGAETQEGTSSETDVNSQTVFTITAEDNTSNTGVTCTKGKEC